MLGEFSRQIKSNRTVVYVDMRSGYRTIPDGFIRVITEEEIFKKEFLETLETIFNVGSAEVMLNSVLKKAEEITIMQQFLDKIVEEYPSEVLTLVVDEASIPLTINDWTSEEDIEVAKKILSLFVHLTKRHQKVTHCYLILCLFL